MTRGVRVCASRPTRHSSASRQPTEGYNYLDSTLSHKAWVCASSALLCTVATRGLAKLHTLRAAGDAVWVLLGAFLLAGWSCVEDAMFLPPQLPHRYLAMQI